MNVRVIGSGLIAVAIGWAVLAFGNSPEPLTVSPGAADRLTGVEVRCPTFSWQTILGAVSTEVVVYQLPPNTDLAWWSIDEATEVLFMAVPEGVNAWTPPLENALARGADHVWYVRGVFEDRNATDWSRPRFFTVAPVLEPEPGSLGPSLGGTGSTSDRGSPARATRTRSEEIDPEARRGSDAGGSPGSAKDASAAAAGIRAEMSGPTGEEYGVVGIVNTPDGAGLAAVNLVDGPDLVLDGSANSGQADTLINQSGIDRPSPNAQGFVFENTGGGTMEVEVIGSILGDGSGLTAVDAETVDGLDGTDLATDVEVAALVGTHAASADHDGRYYTETELDTSGAGGSVHWNNISARPPGLDDGDDDTMYTAGFGLQLNATEFSAIRRGRTPRSNDISVVDAEGVAGRNSSITIGSGGLPVISYSGAGALKIAVVECTESGCTPVSINTVDASGAPQSTSIAVGIDGLPIISYTDSLNFDLKVAHCGQPDCSTAAVTTIDSVGNVGRYSSIMVGQGGLPVISYYDSTNLDLKVARCDDVDCSSATVNTVVSTDSVGSYSSLAIGADGLPVISFHATTGYDLHVAHCSDPSCSAASVNTIDSVGNVGYDSSIAVGRDGLPVISYYHGTGSELRVAHCTDQACSSATISTIDAPGNIGFGTSITVGDDGLPIVSYSDGTNDDLKVAHCSDMTCSQAIISTVDSVGAVGRDSAITIDSDGGPSISYHDESGLDLKMVRCANEFCVPYLTRR